MAKRREPGQKEYNPLDDARGRLPIDDELIRAVVSDTAPSTPSPYPDEKPHLANVSDAQSASAAAVAAQRLAEPRLEESRPEEPLREEFRREPPRREERP